MSHKNLKQTALSSDTSKNYTRWLAALKIMGRD